MNLESLHRHIQHLDPSSASGSSDAERDYFRHYGLDFEDRYEEVTHHFGHFPCGRFDIVAHYFEHKNAIETCFILHGYFDHSGLYRHVIDYCLKRNFSVVIYDLPGHGLSTGERASIRDFAEYQQVLEHVLVFFKDHAPRPWYAIGQSTGGAILMDFLLAGGEDIFTKTVLLAPLIRPSRWPISRVAHSIGKLFLKQVSREFAVNSHDQEFLDFVLSRDPLQSPMLSVQWVTALKRWLKHFMSMPGISYSPLVIQGRDDTTVDWRFNMPVIKQKFIEAKFFYIEEGRHQLANENEDIRKMMFDAMDVYFDVYSCD